MGGVTDGLPIVGSRGQGGSSQKRQQNLTPEQAAAIAKKKRAIALRKQQLALEAEELALEDN